jgi:hypothetical protein
MIWIVDGTRRKKDKERFFSGSKGFLTTGERHTYWVKDPQSAVPNEWINSKSIVCFDFGMNDNGSHTVYMLYKTQKAQHYQCTVIVKASIVKFIADGSLLGIMNESAVKHQISKRSSNSANQFIQHRGKFIKKRRW